MGVRKSIENNIVGIVGQNLDSCDALHDSFILVKHLQSSPIIFVF